jgi:hypothetical protein
MANRAVHWCRNGNRTPNCASSYRAVPRQVAVLHALIEDRWLPKWP